MTKAGGIPAFPIAQPGMSGQRPLGKGGPPHEGAEPGFGFPEHLTKAEGRKGKGEVRSSDLQVPRKAHSLARESLADILAATGGANIAQRGEAKASELPDPDSISDFVADLKRLLADKPSAQATPDKTDADSSGTEQLAEASLESLENVISFIPQMSARQTGSSLRSDVARTETSEAKIVALPFAPRQGTAAILRNAHASVAADGNGLMPAAENSTETMEAPAIASRPISQAAARLSGADAKSEPGHEVAAPEVKITAIRQETHFAPMMRTSPAIQIADRIANGLSDLETESARRATFDPAAAKSGSTAPLRVLQVQLQPVELGTVTISMSLKADVLELHLDATRADTADMLRRDREVLSDLLRQAGYDVGSVSVRIAETDAGALSGGSQSSQTAGQQLQSASIPGQQQASGSAADDRSRGTRQQDQGQQSVQSDAETARMDRADASGSRGIYI